MNPILLYDIGSTNTKITAVDLDEEKILGTARAFTTIQTDIREGMDNALANLREKIGDLDFSGAVTLASSSAAGGLRMIASGLVPELTTKAAHNAALCAGAKVIKTYAYSLSRREAEEIEAIAPEIYLLSGGTDGGNSEVLLNNARVIAQIPCDFPVILAGNKSAADEAAEIISASGKRVILCENVMPEFGKLNIDPARDAIRQVFLDRIVKAKGYTAVQEVMDDILMPTPSAVMKAVDLLSFGTENEPGVGDIIAMDVGGATTDMYSVSHQVSTMPNVVLKGLPEPIVKRSVEGDMGVRYNAHSIVEIGGMKEITALSGLSEERVQELLDLIEKDPSVLPKDCEDLGPFDLAIAKVAVRNAALRHAGEIEESFTPMGTIYVQTGKDLCDVHTIVGTGGPVISSQDPKAVLESALRPASSPYALLPTEANFYLDSQYIMCGMGLLSTRYPDAALRILKKELTLL